jgi:DNA-binding HxlR family transcriptional regulator
MRSYAQYCGLAKALDVVGDRWTLLIVRELLIAGPCRYTDLLDGLPGIATNLLTDRLAQLEADGLVTRAAVRPAERTLYRLTPRGEELRLVIRALGSWARPLLGARGRGEVFRGHWLALPLELYLSDRTPRRRAISIEIRCGGETLVLETKEGEIRVRPGSSEHPDARISGTPELILGVLLGRLELPAGRARGLHYEGDPRILRRLQPAREEKTGLGLPGKTFREPAPGPGAASPSRPRAAAAPLS